MATDISVIEYQGKRFIGADNLLNWFKANPNQLVSVMELEMRRFLDDVVKSPTIVTSAADKLDEYTQGYEDGKADAQRGRK